MKRSIFRKTTHPYYISAPDYVESSSGVIALHHLCHALNISGFNAYLYGAKYTNSKLDTPLLDEKTFEEHKNSNIEGISVYPEIVTGNPLQTKTVVRFMLNKEGVVKGNKISAEANDIFFYYSESFTPDTVNRYNLLTVPTIDIEIFKPDNSKEKKTTLLYLNRIPESAVDFSSLPKNIEIISNKRPLPLDELATKLQSASVLYSYELSGTCAIAILCGCPVVAKNIPGYEKYGFTEQNLLVYSKYGYTQDDTPSAIAAARKTIPKFIKKFALTEKTFWDQLEKFVNITQNKAQENHKTTLTNIKPLDFSASLSKPEEYIQWIKLRENIINRYRTPIDLLTYKENTSFHLICVTLSNHVAQLADTLDSLADQIHPNWIIDIFTDHPLPCGLEEIPCIRWNVCDPKNLSRGEIENTILATNYGIVIEIPSGIVLDPLYLWRITISSEDFPDAKVFFVDDDVYDSTGRRAHPRLKPGANPSLLISSDLAGVLAVRREAWNPRVLISSCPWHDQLFHAIEKYGVASISHIPDVLLSYFEVFPYDKPGHRTSLQSYWARNGVNIQLFDTGQQSWCIRFPLSTTPSVSVAIIYSNDIIIDIIEKCLNGLLKYTSYPYFDITIVTPDEKTDPLLLKLINDLGRDANRTIRIISNSGDSSYGNLCNLAASSSLGEFLLIMDDSVQITQESWLEELVRTCLLTGVVATVPRMIQPRSLNIEYAGEVLGLNGIFDTPYREQFSYRDKAIKPPIWTETPRDLSTLPSACFLVRKTSYRIAGGMDEGALKQHYAAQDLGLKLRAQGGRIIFQPLSNISFEEKRAAAIPKQPDAVAYNILSVSKAKKEFMHQWWPNAAMDPFWNPRTSNTALVPKLELDYLADWHIIPSTRPRIAARPVDNGQGFFRVTSPLNALQRAGMAQQCIWMQSNVGRQPIASEIIRLKCDSLIVQNYLNDAHIKSLVDINSAPGRPFLVFAIDDLFDGLIESNPLSSTVPTYPRERLKYAISHCDRLVVSTAYLAECYSHFISDIVVVPNRLEMGTWLPLVNKKNVTSKPRIVWAGGISHHDDLLLLRDIIEQTRHEADWIFMGMCPDEIRPMLYEYHAPVNLVDYPAYLASLNIDIAVAPLAEVPFNRAKSNLRLLEYGILGIPVICTDIEPYRNSPACCVANTTEAWIAALRDRIHNAKAREAEGQNMRTWVQQNYLLENHLQEWLEAHLPG